MNTNFIEYDFNTDTVSYPSNYDSTKLNLGHLMVKNTDDNGVTYVSPIEPRFLRGFESLSLPPFNWGLAANPLGSVGFLKYNSNVSWVFFTNGNSPISSILTFFLATYTKDSNEFNMVGRLLITPPNYTTANHEKLAITPSMEYHTGGTVSVNSTGVTGVGTTWQTDGVCSGNRIGFGSTNSSGITQWYRVSSVLSNTSLIISSEFETDGLTNGLSYPIGTSYVIEDFRLIYANYATATAADRGVMLVKGLRYENFTYGAYNSGGAGSTIPAATTVDNLRAVYRILDSTGTIATFAPIGIIMEDKTSFTQQDLFTLSYPAATTSSIQKFNIRAPLTFLTAGRSNSPFLFTTGAQAHNGTNVAGYNPFIKGLNNNYYITTFTRIVRIVPANIISGSTTFISDSMVELPPGTTTTFSLSSNLVSSHYLPLAQRFYIPNTTATRHYVTPYISGSTTQFERVVLTNDQVQSNTYTVLQITTPTSNYGSQQMRSYYHDGLSYILRDVNSSNGNVMYTLTIEADKQYHTTSNACIITPEFLTPSATSYNKIYVNAKTYFNDDNRFIVPRENYDIFYRTTGITTDIGSWTLINQNGSMSGVTGTSIQFKLAFSTIGHTCVPSLIYGIGMSYNSDAPPPSIPFYEPSLKFTDKSSQIFTWRQNAQFSVQSPAVMIDIYDSSNNLLLTDNVFTQSGGTFQVSSNDGVTWNNWTYSANSVGNYLRYSSSTLSALGLIVKPILFPATPTPTTSFIPTPTPSATPIPTPTPTPTIDSDATTFLTNAAITATTIQSAINQFVIDLKYFNLWNKLIAVYPFVGGTAFSHKFNLKNPLDTNAAFRLNFINTWTHSSIGAQPNSTTNAYADTFLVPNTHLSNISFAVANYMNSNLLDSTARSSWGAFVDNTNSLISYRTDSRFYRNNVILGTGLMINNGKGFFGIFRNDNTNYFVVDQNGNIVSTASASYTSITNSMLIGTAGIGTFDNQNFAFFSVSSGLTDIEMLNLRGIVTKLQNTLGRA